MAQLLVRNVEIELVRELKLRAARRGHSAEEEHRQILQRVLGGSGTSGSLKELLLEIPNVGEDRDFQRVDERPRAVQL